MEDIYDNDFEKAFDKSIPSDKPLMKCGHSANATSNDKPICVICGCDELADFQPNLTGRKAKCSYCKKEADSNVNLPFFEYKPDKEYDEYYCGCYGWD